MEQKGFLFGLHNSKFRMPISILCGLVFVLQHGEIHWSSTIALSGTATARTTAVPSIFSYEWYKQNNSNNYIVIETNDMSIKWFSIPWQITKFIWLSPNNNKKE